MLLIKQQRATGGCLDDTWRRRTWQAAKSLGEPQAGFNPGVSEWGNPLMVKHQYFDMNK